MVAHSVRRRSSRARMTSRRAANSPVMAWLARAGLAARGVMYILIGVIAVEIATGGTKQKADNSGAIRLVASTPFGKILLWLRRHRLRRPHAVAAVRGPVRRRWPGRP